MIVETYMGIDIHKQDKHGIIDKFYYAPSLSTYYIENACASSLVKMRELIKTETINLYGRKRRFKKD